MKSGLYIVLVNWFKFWARIKLEIWRPKIIGITGSMGKTSFLHILDSLFKHSNLSHKSSFKANSEIGLPLDILGLKPAVGVLGWFKPVILAPFKAVKNETARWYLAEMGIDSLKYPYNMDFLLSLFIPEIAVCLEVTSMHSLQFSQDSGLVQENEILDLIADQKTKLLKAVLLKGGWVIYNQDNTYIKAQMESFLQENQDLKSMALSLSLVDNLANIKVSSQLKGTDFYLTLTYKTKTYDFVVKGMGLFTEYARLIAAAVVIGLELGMNQQQIQAGLDNFNLPGRFSLLRGIKNTVILDSSYNAPYDAMVRIINHFYHLFEKRSKILVLGEMRELGALSQKKHEQLAKMVSRLEFDHLFLVGQDMKRFFLPIVEKLKPKAKVDYFKYSHHLGDKLKEVITGGEAILFKGSQNTIFLEEAIKKVLKDPAHQVKLVRQSPAWRKRKSRYFTF